VLSAGNPTAALPGCRCRGSARFAGVRGGAFLPLEPARQQRPMAAGWWVGAQFSEITCFVGNRIY
jgi:hypothetical protein